MPAPPHFSHPNYPFSRAQQWGSETAAVSHACRCRACLYTAVDCCRDVPRVAGPDGVLWPSCPGWMWSWRLLERLCVLGVCHVSSLEREVRVASLPKDVEMPRRTAMHENKHLLPALPCAILRCIVWRLLRPVAAHCGVPMSSCCLCSRAPRAGGSYGCHTDAATTTPFLRGRPGGCRG